MILPGPLVDGLSGIVYVLLAGWVAYVGRGNRAVLGFLLLAGGLGISVAVANLRAPYNTGGPPEWNAVRDVARVIAVVGILVVGLRFPTPLARRETKLALAAMLLPAAVIAYNVRGLEYHWAHPRDAFHALSFGVVSLLALRYRATSDAAARPSFALLAAALGIYPAYAAVAPVFYAGLPIGQDWVFLPLGLFAGAVALWLRNLDMGLRHARIVVWLLLGSGLAAAISVSVLRGTGWNFGWGLARTLSVAVLAYAILRHQLLGFDVKLRFAISKSALAAVFVAVFFVASETAQQFFGDQFQSGYLGILAAGALVFAFAPLSRLADRIAERAVPLTGGGASGPPASEAEAAYGNAVRLALRDRPITRAEERDLFHLATTLGLPARRAHEILAEMEERVKRG